MSRTELSSKAGVSRQTIDDLESGNTRDPSTQNVNRLCEVLEVLPEFLYFEPGDTPPTDALHLRSRHKDVPKYVIQRLQAKAELFERISREIGRHVRLPDVRFPSAFANLTSRSPDDLAAAARACRVMWEVPPTAPIQNLTRLLERAGALVGNFRDDFVPVQAFCWVTWRPLIFVNRFSRDGRPVPVTRVRFDLAHETGHIVLHGGHVAGDAAREQEANRFASELLLPRDPFAKEFALRRRQLDWELIWGMKGRWGVSAQAIVRRAQDLDLISTELVRRFWITINKQGFLRHEPREPNLVEEPEITRNIADALEDECDISTWELAQAVALTARDFTELSGIPVAAPTNVIPLHSRAPRRAM